MKINELRPSPGSRHKRKRVGRGPGSGHGCTAGRGSKGQKARSKVRLGFEGGQMPLIRRIPKRGFTPKFKREWAIVNLQRIEGEFSAGDNVTSESLIQKGIVKKGLPVKILGKGDITKSLKISVNSFSKGAKEKIEKAGGTVEKLKTKD